MIALLLTFALAQEAPAPAEVPQAVPEAPAPPTDEPHVPGPAHGTPEADGDPDANRPDASGPASNSDADSEDPPEASGSPEASGAPDANGPDADAPEAAPDASGAPGEHGSDGDQGVEPPDGTGAHAPEPASPDPLDADTQGQAPSTPEPRPAADAPPQPQPSDFRVPVPAPSPTPGFGSDFFGFFPDTPAPAPREVVYLNASGEAVPGPLDAILPHPPHQGLSSFLKYGLGAAFCWALALAFRRGTTNLRPSGLLPWALGTLEVLLRIGAAALTILAFGAMVPAWLEPALPVVAIAVAVAVGWSARDVVKDLVAGALLMAEGQLRAGHWLQGERYSGTVESIGPRVTWLRDGYGRRILVPNRVLIEQPLVADDNPWPRIQFTVAMPSAPSSAVRAALEEAIVVSPWVAPDPDIEVHPDSLHDHHWHIAVRLLDSRYADRFQGLLRERVEECLPRLVKGPADA